VCTNSTLPFYLLLIVAVVCVQLPTYADNMTVLDKNSRKESRGRKSNVSQHTHRSSERSSIRSFVSWQTWHYSLLLFQQLLCSPPQGGIKRYRDPSVHLSQPRLWAHWLPAASRPPETCRLRTRPRTDVDLPRVDLPSAGAYRLDAPGEVNFLPCSATAVTITTFT